MKKITAFILTLALAFCCTTFVLAEEEAPIALTINGAAVECDVPPQLVDDTTMVPFRAIIEALNAFIIAWDEASSTVHAQTPDGSIVSMQIGSNKLFKSNQVIEMDVAPVIIGDRTMVSVRAIAECIGYNVEWIAEKREVQITK